MTTAGFVDDRRTRWVRALLACGVVGPPLFVVALLVEGATRPGYSVWRNLGSQLATGPYGWTQIVNFIVCGLLVCARAAGLRQAFRSGRGSTFGPALLGVWGLALITAGVFVTDPALGYPPGTPETAGGPKTLHGTIHGFSGLVAFVSVTVAAFVLARRFAAEPDGAGKAWARYSVVSGALVLAFFFASFMPSSLLHNPPTGLFQRGGIVAGWVWAALVALRELRALPARDYPEPGRLREATAR
jgi:hypothetical membrane protein